MATASKPRIANPIAQRRLSVVGEPDREVVLTFGKPRYSTKNSAWGCSFLVEGIPKARRRVAYGVDTLQALQNAVEAARRMLDESRLVLTWEDGYPGEIGLPHTIPSYEGSGFEQRMERYIAREHKKFLRDVMAGRIKKETARGTPER